MILSEPYKRFLLGLREFFENENPDLSYRKPALKGSGLGGIPLEQIEQWAILDTIRQTGGNKTKAAKVLGISDRTLLERMHRYRREGCLQTA